MNAIVCIFLTYITAVKYNAHKIRIKNMDSKSEFAARKFR